MTTHAQVQVLLHDATEALFVELFEFDVGEVFEEHVLESPHAKAEVLDLIPRQQCLFNQCCLFFHSILVVLSSRQCHMSVTCEYLKHLIQEQLKVIVAIRLR
jgi:hypothetical protein